MMDLSPARALIFRITHIANVPWILANGLHSESSNVIDPDHVSIGNPDLIEKRKHRAVPMPPGGILSDYVPFYFTPCSPMLYNIKTGYNGIVRRPMADIVILASSLLTLQQAGIPFLFTDRHAYLSTAAFSGNLAALAGLDWSKWQARDFRRDPSDPAKFERYQAEALAYKHVPASALHGIVGRGEEQVVHLKEIVHNLAAGFDIVSKPGWYV